MATWSQFIYAGTEGSYACYHARVRPWLWFLAMTTDCRIFQNLSVPDIVEQIFDKYPTASYSLMLNEQHPDARILRPVQRDRPGLCPSADGGRRHILFLRAQERRAQADRRRQRPSVHAARRLQGRAVLPARRPVAPRARPSLRLAQRARCSTGTVHSDQLRFREAQRRARDPPLWRRCRTRHPRARSIATPPATPPRRGQPPGAHAAGGAARRRTSACAAPARSPASAAARPSA